MFDKPTFPEEYLPFCPCAAMRHRVYRARAGCRTGGQPGTPRLHASRREGMPAGRISAGRKGKEAQTHPGPAEYPQGRDLFPFYYNKFRLEAQHPAGLLSISCLSYNKRSNWLTIPFLGLDVRK